MYKVKELTIDEYKKALEKSDKETIINICINHIKLYRDLKEKLKSLIDETPKYYQLDIQELIDMIEIDNVDDETKEYDISTYWYTKEDIENQKEIENKLNNPEFLIKG
jgi:pyruvate formate-lyase activating enzyme-like uncharacterized protein